MCTTATIEKAYNEIILENAEIIKNSSTMDALKSIFKVEITEKKQTMQGDLTGEEFDFTELTLQYKNEARVENAYSFYNEFGMKTTEEIIRLYCCVAFLNDEDILIF